MKSRILTYGAIILLAVGAVLGWQLWQMHQRNIETGDQMIKTASKMGR